jgi:hypothetical protein
MGAIDFLIQILSARFYLIELRKIYLWIMIMMMMMSMHTIIRGFDRSNGIFSDEPEKLAFFVFLNTSTR